MGELPIMPWLIAVVDAAELNSFGRRVEPIPSPFASGNDLLVSVPTTVAVPELASDTSSEPNGARVL